MGIFEDFDDELFRQIGKHYHELTKSQKIKVLKEAEEILEQISAKRRAIIRQLRRKLYEKQNEFGNKSESNGKEISPKRISIKI